LIRLRQSLTDMRIAFDLDAVLFDYKPVINFLNTTFDKDLSLKDIKGYFLERFYKQSYEVLFPLTAEFIRDCPASEVVPIPGMLEALRTLHEQGHYLIAATARDPICEDRTYREVGRFFGRYIKHVDFSSKLGKGHSKYDLLRARAVDVIVDDRLETVVECARAVIPIRGVVFNYHDSYGWNTPQNGELAGIEHLVRRATTGEEVVRAVEEFQVQEQSRRIVHLGGMGS